MGLEDKSTRQKATNSPSEMQSFVNINPLQLVSLDIVDPFGVWIRGTPLQHPLPSGAALTGIVPGFPGVAHQEAAAPCCKSVWNPVLGDLGMQIPNPPHDFSGRLRLEHVGGVLETQEQTHSNAKTYGRER